MTTILDVVTRAFRKMGVISVDVTLNADEAAEGVTALNDMMHAWKLQEVDIGHTDMEVTDEFPLGPEFVEGTTYMLAQRLNPNYQIPQTFRVSDFMHQLQAAYLVIDDAKLDPTLLKMPSQRRDYFA